MRTLGMAALLAFMLMFTVAATGHAQSAEDLAKGQNSGVRYAYSYADELGPMTDRIYIRGDEGTWTAYRAQNGEHVMQRFRITNKRTEGNKVIFETDSPYFGIITIDGDRLTSPKYSQNGVFTRE